MTSPLSVKVIDEGLRHSEEKVTCLRHSKRGFFAFRHSKTVDAPYVSRQVKERAGDIFDLEKPNFQKGISAFQIISGKKLRKMGCWTILLPLASKGEKV